MSRCGDITNEEEIKEGNRRDDEIMRNIKNDKKKNMIFLKEVITIFRYISIKREKVGNKEKDEANSEENERENEEEGLETK